MLLSSNNVGQHARCSILLSSRYYNFISLITISLKTNIFSNLILLSLRKYHILLIKYDFKITSAFVQHVATC